MVAISSIVDAVGLPSLISAGGSIIGGALSAGAAGSAADAQVQASKDANATTLAMFNQNRADQAPFREAGVGVLPQLSTGLAPGGDFNRDFNLNDFHADPGYAFRTSEGQRQLEQSAAARGDLLSGSTGRALVNYGQDAASGEFSNAYNRFNNDRTTRFNRLSALAGTGQTATNVTGQLGADAAGKIADTRLGAGNATASGYIGQSNAFNNSIGSLSNFYQQQQLLSKLPNQTGSTTSAPIVDRSFNSSQFPFPTSSSSSSFSPF